MILVTGHRGFIGSYLYNELASGDVVGLDIVEGNDILTCDLPDADVVFHLAAQPGVVQSMGAPLRTMEVNVQGTARLAERYRDSKFIFASSGGTIQDEIASVYGLSKKMGEDYLKLMHPHAIILRFANVYGPGSRSVVDKFLNAKYVLPVYGDGTQTRTYVHVYDLVRGALDSINWGPGTYTFGTDQYYSVNDIVEFFDLPVEYRGWREGELGYSPQLKNTTPDWTPRVDLFTYMSETLGQGFEPRSLRPERSVLPS